MESNHLAGENMLAIQFSQMIRNSSSLRQDDKRKGLEKVTVCPYFLQFLRSEVFKILFSNNKTPY